jgi:molybdate transport repressor ModE-like protein
VSNNPLVGLCWDDLRIVKAIGETGSLAAAAASIGINHSTVFRRLGQIEALLEVTLFERRRTGYVATPTGAEVIGLAQRLEVDIVTVTRRLAGLDREPAGELRIATSDTLASRLLMPILAGFKALHPAVRIELVVGNGSLNLAKGETDIAIRATNDPPENLVGRKVAEIAWAPYGRRSDHPDGPPAAAALQDRLWATYSDELSGLRAARFLEEQVPAHNIAYRVNSVQLLAAGIMEGLGAGYLPCLVGDAVPGLIRIGPVDPNLSDALWLLTHPELRKSGRVHLFLEYCAAALIRQRPFIEGRSGAPVPLLDLPDPADGLVVRVAGLQS